ncbi:MAG: PBP1A family penicillin-binding protein [Vulcanimicrobiota bacterium]
MLFLLSLGAVLACFLIGLSVIKHFSKGLPDVSSLRGYEPSQTTRIHSSTGELIATLFKENRTYTKIEDIAPVMREAIVAVEDSRFREHNGVDPRGVIRAAVYDLQHKGAHQGASTITMQLARNLFLNPTRSLERKIREALLSVEIEKRFTKDEILELYLNQIYFGSGAYGIAAASELYFGKKPSELNTTEASLLAGLPQAPSEFSPFVDERSAKMRQILVLGRMRDTGAIPQSEYRKALQETKSLVFDRKPSDVEYELLKYPYFTTYALRTLANKYSEELLYRGGLTIHTTLDIELQKKCESILARMIATDGKKLGADTGAIVLIENRTGYIRALVGGTGWSQNNQFNRSWQARRQPGSTFKPLVYAAALEQGWTPESKIEDSPLTLNLAAGEVWKPSNSDKSYMGEIDLTTALKYSRNVAAARLGQKIGLGSVIKLARRAGIEEELPPHPSLALGSVEITPLEMATAYTIFPNDGIGVESVAIKQVVDGTGEAVESHHFANKRDVLSSKTAQSMVEMMKGVVEEGTAQKAILENHEAAGKTGTTDSFRDAWFVGFTADYTAAVWVGKDDNSQMKKSFGGDLPARIWKQVMEAALADREPTKFFLDRLTEPGSGPATGGSSSSGTSDPDESSGEASGVPDSSPEIVLTVCKETRLRAQPGCPAIVKVNVESAGDVDWCSRHSEQAPELTEWAERQPTSPVYSDPPVATGPGEPATGYPRESGSEHSPPAYQHQPPPVYEQQPVQDHSWQQRRHEGTVRNVRTIDGTSEVEPMNGPRRGRRGGGLDDEGGL